MRTHNVTVLLVEYNDRNALMVWSLPLSVVLFRFRGLKLWLSVCLCVCSAWHPDTLPTHSSLKKRHACTHGATYGHLTSQDAGPSLLSLSYTVAFSVTFHLFLFLSSPWGSFAPRGLLCTLQLQPCCLPEFYFIGFSLQCCHWVTCQIWLQQVQFTTCLYLHGDRHLGLKLPCSATPLMHITLQLCDWTDYTSLGPRCDLLIAIQNI